MGNPIILYDNRFLDGPLTATNTRTGYDVENIKDYRTYTFWRANSFGTIYIKVDCGIGKSADCLGIIGHNFALAYATVSIESSDNDSDWSEELAGFTCENDFAIMKEFTSAEARYWRIKIITASIAPRIACLFLGEKLELPYPPDSPFVPYRESIISSSQRSERGHLLGNIIKNKPIDISGRISNITRVFALGDYKDFWDAYGSEMLPFFWAFDIDNCPDIVYYVKASTGMIMETPISLLNYVDSIDFNFEGVKEEEITDYGIELGEYIDIDDNLLCWIPFYRFQTVPEIIYDHGGYGNNTIITDMSFLSNWFVFGASSNFTIPVATSLDLGDNFTIAFYLRLSSTETGDPVLLSKGDSFQSYSFSLVTGTTKFKFFSEDSGNNPIISLESSATYSSSTEYCIVITRDKATGYVRMYIDGIEDNNVSGITDDLDANTEDLIFSEVQNARIGEFIIINETWDDAQVLAYYNATKAIYGMS